MGNKISLSFFKHFSNNSFILDTTFPMDFDECFILNVILEESNSLINISLTIMK